MLEYIKNFTEEEIDNFSKFIFSPYFNSQKAIHRLFEYLKSLYPDISAEDLSKEKISMAVYSEKNISDLKFRKLISDFTLLTDRFLMQSELDENVKYNEIMLLRSLRKRGFRKRFEKIYNDISAPKRNHFSKDDGDYLNKIYLEDEYYNFNLNDLKGRFIESVQEKSDSLDHYFMFLKLHTFHEMLHIEGSKNKNKLYDRKFYHEIISNIEKNVKVISAKHPNLYIIYLAFQMFNTMDDKYLNKLLKYLKLNDKRFTNDKLCYYYQYITQYYIMKANKGQTHYRQNAFSIFRMMKERKLFVIDNVITDHEFNNVINVTLALQEYKWTDEFIEEYKNFISPVNSKDAYNLAKARLLFHQKDYKNIFKYLNEIEFKDATYYINSKFILGRVYFDLKNIDAVKYIIENLRQYIRTNKILSPEHTSAVKTYNKYMSELMKLYESSKDKKKYLRVILKKELDNEKNLVPTKIWFYEKVAEA